MTESSAPIEQPAPEKPEKAKKKDFLVLANDKALRLAQTINDLLERPIAVLPKEKGDRVKPFKVGLGKEIKALKRQDIDDWMLNGAIRLYVGCTSYLLALAQPNAQRFDLEGEPAEDIIEKDHSFAFSCYRAKAEETRQWKRKLKLAQLQDGTTEKLPAIDQDTDLQAIIPDGEPPVEPIQAEAEEPPKAEEVIVKPSGRKPLTLKDPAMLEKAKAFLKEGREQRILVIEKHK